MVLKRYVALAILITCLCGCSNYYHGKRSNHYDGQHFYNPNQTFHHSLWQLIRWQLFTKRIPWPTSVPIQPTHKLLAHVYGSQLRVTFVGHDTFLIQTQGLNILTDPIWSERASPFSWIGPKRVTRPGINFIDLPKIDLVLISHNHYDHLDLATLKKLWQRDQPRIIVPLGNDTIIKDYDSAIKVQAYDWGNAIPINSSIKVYLLPAQHWSARGLFDRNKALWAAFVITTPSSKLYFAGDAGYGNDENFIQAGKKFGNFRLVFLPIGAYEPRWFMADSHMNPSEAVLAFQTLNARYGLGMHFGTFHLTNEGYEQPLQELITAEKLHHLSPKRFRALAVGQAWNVPRD